MGVTVVKDTTSQRGATLLMIIGVVAALAVLSAAMVVLFVNVQHNTMTDRMQTTAFNVAEAGISAGQSALWGTWPSTESQAGTPVIPASLAGGTVAVAFYDDDGATPPDIRRAYSYDANGNGIMWVVSRGTSSERSAKIMVCVKQTPFNPNILGNVALFGLKSVTVNGGGGSAGADPQPVIGYESGATSATVYAPSPAFLTLHPNDILTKSGSTVAANTDAGNTVSSVIPDETLATLIGIADSANKVYADASKVPATAWTTNPRIIVIKTGGIDLKSVPNTETDALPPTVWSESSPGILITLDPAGLVSLDGGAAGGSTKSFYGILYAMGDFDLKGNATWHGMVLIKGGATVAGTLSVIYNPNVIANLNKPTILAVQQFPNTWRELSAN